MMRVCELAKKMRTSSLEVLKQADALDIEAYSPLSQLDAADASRLQEVFSKRSASEIEAESAARAACYQEKRTAAATRRVAQVQTERAVLEANRARALEMDAKINGRVPAVSAAPAEPSSVTAEASVAAPSPAAAPVRVRGLIC